MRPACGDVQLLVFIFQSAGKGMRDKNNPSLVFSGDRKIPTRGPPYQWETRLAKFPTEWWTRGLGFFWNHLTPMIDSFSHIPRPYGTVLSNIC